MDFIRLPEHPRPEPPPGFTAVQIFDDQTPNAVIQKRIIRHSMEVAARFSDLERQEGDDFINLIILIGRKMASVYRYLQGYHAEEARLIEKFSDASVKHFDASQVLYEEFDVFAVQIKSTLDHLVKIMRPMIGRRWTMYTFGDKGDAVLRALKGNTGKKHHGRVRAMEHLLFSKQHRLWLEAIIETRDRVNHGIAGGLDIRNFVVRRTAEGNVELPMWSKEERLAAVMDAIWVQFFNFVQDFIMLALHFRIPEDRFGVFKKPDPPITAEHSPWVVVAKAEADRIIKELGATPL